MMNRYKLYYDADEGYYYVERFRKVEKDQVKFSQDSNSFYINRNGGFKEVFYESDIAKNHRHPYFYEKIRCLLDQEAVCRYKERNNLDPSYELGEDEYCDFMFDYSDAKKLGYEREQYVGLFWKSKPIQKNDNFYLTDDQLYNFISKNGYITGYCIELLKINSGVYISLFIFFL